MSEKLKCRKVSSGMRSTSISGQVISRNEASVLEKAVGHASIGVANNGRLQV